jgi:hypothetical protein
VAKGGRLIQRCHEKCNYVHQSIPLSSYMTTNPHIATTIFPCGHGSNNPHLAKSLLRERERETHTHTHTKDTHGKDKNYSSFEPNW